MLRINGRGRAGPGRAGHRLDPAVALALTEFAAAGGVVLKAGGGTQEVPGAIDLGVTSKLPDEDLPEYQQLFMEKKWGDLAKYQTMAKFFQGAEPLTKALRSQLDKAGIQPAVTSDQTGIAATVQGAGDVDYVFLVNATPDPDRPERNAMKATAASIAFPIAGRMVYDAIHGMARRSCRTRRSSAPSPANGAAWWPGSVTSSPRGSNR